MSLVSKICQPRKRMKVESSKDVHKHVKPSMNPDAGTSSSNTEDEWELYHSAFVMSRPENVSNHCIYASGAHKVLLVVKAQDHR